MSLILDRYEVVRRLAVGGMGEVFLAVQRGAGDVARPVILKAMLPDLAKDPVSVQAFLDEARVIATLNHANVVSLFEVGVWQGLPLIAMEFVQGRTVSGLIKRALERGVAISAGVCLTIARDAARGLHHAHQAKDPSGQPLHLIHRDVSPQNVMVRFDGVSKVLDFGIAHTAARAGRTATGLVKGKLAYMAPEQARGDRLDQRADQFALGVVLWELLAQRRLFKAEDELKLLQLVLAPEVPRPSSFGAPPECDALLERMLSARAEDRFSDCAQVATALDALIARLGGGGAEAVAAFMSSLGSDDVDAPSIPSLGDALSPLGVSPGFSAPAAGDVPTATRAGVLPIPVSSPRRWPSRVLVAVLVLGFGAGAAWLNQRQRNTLAAETQLRIALDQNARLAEKTVDGFCADAARLNTIYPRVEAHPGGKGAAPFFDSLLGWEGCPSCGGNWEVNVGGLRPPQVLLDKMQTPEDASVPRWRTVLTREDLAALDFRWLNELPQYDSWWLSGHERLRRFSGPALHSPLPNFTWLQAWAKFRYARAILDADVPRAVEEIGHLRRLLRTMGSLVAEMIALALQGIERGAIEEAELRGQDVGALARLSLSDMAEVRSVAFAAYTYAWPGVSPAVMERAYACAPSPCVMLWEAAWLHSLEGDGLTSPTRGAFEALVERSQCDREAILQMARRRTTASELESSELTLDPVRRLVEKL